ncbi:MAG: hypothetical protein K2W95_21410 [Candidatus Obscuribacterales bacterium]|nr:hypothetical protein [Candidatus Obscuribacterales bacterium]
MNLSEIRLLQQFRDYPSVSIMLQLRREQWGPSGSRTRLEFMVNEVQRRLQRTAVPLEDVVAVIKNIRALIDTVDFKEKAGSSVAILANRYLAKKTFLPNFVKENIAIGESFSLRALVNSATRAPHFRVLLLSPKEIRLLAGNSAGLRDSDTNQFPMTHPAKIHSSFEQAHLQTFFGQADGYVADLCADDASPLILIGTARDIAVYRAITAIPHGRIAGILAFAPGSSELWISQMHPCCLSLVKEYENRQRVGALRALDEALATDNYATGIHEVWRRAEEGRCKTLVVEENYQCPATVQDDFLRVETANLGDRCGPKFLPDAIDTLIERVLANGGNVSFVDDGTLTRFGQVAAVLYDRQTTVLSTETNTANAPNIVPPIDITWPSRVKVTTGHN